MSAKHFRLIHPAPQEYWLLLVQLALKYSWSTEDLELRVKSVSNTASCIIASLQLLRKILQLLQQKVLQFLLQQMLFLQYPETKNQITVMSHDFKLESP